MSSQENSLVLRIKMESDYSKIPVKGSPGAACYDLYSAEEKTIPPGDRKAINTGIRINFRGMNVVGEIWSRSGITLRNKIDVCGGIIDPDYTGIIMVVLHNAHRDEPFKVNVGDRIAQIKFSQFLNNVDFVIDKETEWEETIRGVNGFGSSGKN